MTKTAFEFNDHLDPKPYGNCIATNPHGGFKWRRTLTKTLVMKLAIFLLTAAFFQAHGTVIAQKVTISGKEITLKQVFEAIEKQTDFVVFSNESFLTKTKKVSITVHDVSVTELLDLVLRNQPVLYSIRNKTIFLSPKPDATTPDPISDLLRPEAPPLTIRGFLRTAEGEFLSGASIRIRQASNGAITDSKGGFQLKTNEENPVVVMSMVGYETVEVFIKKTAAGYQVTKYTGGQGSADDGSAGVVSLVIIMKKSVSTLDETQVTAYGRTTRRLATGNIGTIKAEEIERQPVLTALEAIIGRVPGVTVRQISGNAASPVQVIIRGRNSINPNAMTDPLYVIDGIPMSNLNASSLTESSPMSMGAVQGGYTNTIGENPLLSINPRDIESISILKDADATAIYGSRGANGVILINTKRSKPGPTTFNVRVNNGTKMIQKYPKLLNTQEYLAVRKEAFSNDGLTPNRENAPDLTVWDQTKYTDWQRILIGTGSVTNADASVSGGMGQSNYMISAGYSTQKELMNVGGKNNRGTFRSNFSHTSSNQKFNFNINNNITLLEVDAYAIGDLNNLSPNAPDIYLENGDFNFEPYRKQYANIFPFVSLRRPSESKTFSLQSIVSLRYEILRGLTLSATGGYMFSSNENARYQPEASIDMYFPGSFSSAVFGRSTAKNWHVEPQIQYNTYIGKGSLSLQLITNLQNAISRGETIFSFMFPNDAMMKSYNNAAFNTFQEGYKEYKYLSASGIIRYAWDNKYVLNLNARRDGSSRFGPGKQFGDFGSVGLAWVASDEKWMKRILPDWFSFVKFRASYGTSGSDGIGDYEYLSRWSRSLLLNDPRTLFKYNGVDAFQVIKPLNQEFQWESSKKAEIAASFGFLKDRVNVEIVYYRNNSQNQLTSVPIPLYTSFSEAVSNWPAEVQNSGLEISATAKLIDSKDWGLNVNFNFSRNRNKLVDFPNLENSSYKNSLKIGYSTTEQFFFHYTGIDPLTGSYTFEDHNKDGRLFASANGFPVNDLDDRYVLVDYMEKFNGGFGINLNYKRLTLYSQFYFVNKLRQDPYLGTPVGAMNNISLPAGIRDNHWKQPGDLVKYPRYTTDATSLGPFASSDAAYVNGSYVRLTSMALSWQLPSGWLGKIKMKDARFSIETQNLLTLSPYKGLDPEISSAATASPVPRTITTSLSFTF